MALKQGVDVKPAGGKLGILMPGMGAVATPVEVSELATALATGLVVGQEIRCRTSSTSSSMRSRST